MLWFRFPNMRTGICFILLALAFSSCGNMQRIAQDENSEARAQFEKPQQTIDKTIVNQVQKSPGK